MVPCAATNGGRIGQITTTHDNNQSHASSHYHMSYKTSKSLLTPFIFLPPICWSPSLFFFYLTSFSLHLHLSSPLFTHNVNLVTNLTNLEVGFIISSCYLWFGGWLEFHSRSFTWCYTVFIWILMAGLTCIYWVWMGNWVKS